MRDITVIIRDRPITDTDPVSNQIAWQVDTSNYRLIIHEQELTPPSVNRGIREILKMEKTREKSRQCGNTDGSKGEVGTFTRIIP